MYFDTEPSLCFTVVESNLIFSSKIAKWGGCSEFVTNASFIFSNCKNPQVSSEYITLQL